MNNNHKSKDVSRKGYFIDVEGTKAFYLFPGLAFMQGGEYMRRRSLSIIFLLYGKVSNKTGGLV
jgi:hypothetical protein